MALQFRNTSTNLQSFGTSNVVDVPSGVQNGDMMLLQVSTASTISITDHASWSLLESITGTGGTGNTNNVLKVYYRIASSEPASYTISHGSGASRCSIIAWYSDTESDIVVNVHTQGRNEPATANHVAPSVNTTLANSQLHAFLCCENSFGGTPPDPMAERWDSLGSTASYLATELVTGTGATGTRTITGNSVAGLAVTVAIAESSIQYPFTATLSAISDTPNVALGVGYPFAGTLTADSATPDNALLGIGMAMIATLTADSATSDAALLVQRALLATLTAQSATPDTVLLGVAETHLLAAILTAQSATPPVTLSVFQHFAATLTAASATPDDVLLLIHQLWMATLTAQSDTSIVDLDIIRRLPAVFTAAGATSDAALLVERYMLAEMTAESATPDDALLNQQLLFGLLTGKATVWGLDMFGVVGNDVEVCD